MEFADHTLTTCTFCGVGCGIYLEASEGLITGAYPSMTHPANQGRICVRGWHVHEVSSSPDRLTQPMMKKDGQFIPVRWEQALDFVSTRLRMIRKENGADSIGFLNSPRCSNEETYLLQKFARTVVGTNNVDRGGSLHRVNTIDVLQEMIGIPAATSSIDELEKTELIVVDGIDLGRQLPTIGGRVLRAKLAGAKLIVIGSRSHRVAHHADLFLPDQAGYRPAALRRDGQDHRRSGPDEPEVHPRSTARGFQEWLEKIQEFDVLWAAEHCGVDPELIEQAALAYAKASSAMILYSTGVEARGKGAVQALVSLCLLCGNIGRPGAGLMPLAEYNNLQGGCDMGMLPDRLPGLPSRQQCRRRGRTSRSSGEGSSPPSPGLDIWSMFC